MEGTLIKKTALAQKVAAFFTDTHNLNMNTAIRAISGLGATVFISQRVPPDPYAREITMAGRTKGHFHRISLSQLGIIMPSAQGENTYRFMLGELRMVTEKEGKGACTINLNNIVFFEAAHEYLKPLSTLFAAYDAYEKMDTAPGTKTWIADLGESLKTNGGKELIDRLKELGEEKSEHVQKQRYNEAAKVRDQENLVLGELQDFLEKLLFSETE